MLSSGLGDRKGIIIYGFDYPGLPMDPAIEAFETLARTKVSLGPRVVAAYADLINPVHTAGRVFGWELRPVVT